MSDSLKDLENLLDELTFDDVNMYEVAASGNTLDDCAVELGIYFAMLTVCFLVLLDQVRGKPDHIKNWLMFRKLDILGGEE